MIFTAKAVISVLASLGALGAVGGVVYALDKNSLSEGEIQKMVGIDPYLMNDRLCKNLSEEQAKRWSGDICREGFKDFRKEEEKRVVSNGQKDKRYELDSPNNNSHLLTFGEEEVNKAVEKAGLFKPLKR